MTSNSGPSVRKRVLVLTSTFPRWEGDNEPPFVFELCRRLCPDFDVWVLAPHTPGAKTYETLGGIAVVRFRYFFERGETLAYRGGILANLRDHRFRYLLVPLFIGFQFMALLRLLDQHRFDVMHAHWLIPQGVTAALAGLCQPHPPPLLCTAHGSDLHGLRGPVFSAIKRWVVRHCDALTTVSLAMKTHALAVGADQEKTSVISMGVDTEDTFTPSMQVRRNDSELLFVGRLSTQKGVELLIRAMPDIVAVNPGCLLRVVGDGPDKDLLRNLCETLGIARNVKFAGAITNKRLPEFYQRAAMLVFPSTSEEGFGLVCVEALACGCPVIASDLLATREVVQDGETGLLFKRGDRGDLLGKILTLLANPVLCQKMGKAGRNFVTQRFDWSVVSQRYGELLNNMCRLEA